MTAVLDAIDIRKAFSGIVALDDLSLSVEAGERVGLIGRNGTAKSEEEFERRLYILRKSISQAIYQRRERGLAGYYPVSMSCRTVIYKGMFLADQLGKYYPDLHEADFESALALVHQRFSTNTFPAWSLAHPYRMIAHNGEINTVRKHLSRIKGGRLTRHAHPAKLLTIAISDVPGDDPSAIGSGPTVPDPTTLADARAIIAKYKIAAPAAVTQALSNQKNESPKPGDPAFAGSQFRLAARPADAMRAAENAVRAAGYECISLGDRIELTKDGTIRRG